MAKTELLYILLEIVMKRVVFFVGVLVVPAVFGLCGCGVEAEKESVPSAVIALDVPEILHLDEESNPTTYFMGIPPVPDSLDFAGEPVPLDRWYVREALMRELTVLSYWHASMTYILQLSTRYFPLIQPILKKEGVPEDFIYLCVAESSLQQLVSPAGAAGFWQFMKGTARERGLEVDNEVDERYHIEKATRAAAAYLKDAYAKYGNWTAAAASYNMGTAGFTKQVNRQRESNYYNMQLPNETMRYLFRILAFKTVIPQPETYGYVLKESDYLQPIDCQTVKVPGRTDWIDFAKSHRISYRELRLFNPWIRDVKVSNGKTYQVKLPIPQ